MKITPKRLVVTFVCMIVAVIAIMLVIVKLALSESEPVYNFAITDKSIAAMGSVNQKIHRELAYIYSKQADNKPREIIFNKHELDILFQLGISGARISKGLYNGSETKLIDGKFDNGVFKLVFSGNINFESPFGSYCIITADFVPEIDKNRIKIDLLTFKAGRVRIPVFIVNLFLKREIAEINNNPQTKQFLNAIKSFKINKDNIIITYYPKQLQTLLLNYNK